MAMVIVAPVWAQTTITAPGLIGPAACVGQGETADPNFGTISSVTNNNANFRAQRIANMYGNLRSRIGDGGPTEFPTNIKVYNAKTNAQAGTTQILATFRQAYTELTQDFNFTLSSLAEKTPYYAVVYTTAAGFGEGRPFVRRCFMTGGTYTPANATLDTSMGSTGCFSITPLTFHDVRNCLCGRGNTGTVGSQNYDYTSLRSNWGCANR
ncbi:MAG: hypothetical protein OXC17_13250 [Aestuariivita sp.]|nr:hypothetical protein [Aestuariivita sp.]